MSRPTGPEDPKYGGGPSPAGLPLTTDAPSWDGDLAALTDNELRDRLGSLDRLVANMHHSRDREGQWRPAYPTRTELRPWAEKRVAVLCELDQRPTVTTTSLGDVRGTDHTKETGRDE